MKAARSASQPGSVGFRSHDIDFEVGKTYDRATRAKVRLPEGFYWGAEVGPDGKGSGGKLRTLKMHNGR